MEGQRESGGAAEGGAARGVAGAAAAARGVDGVESARLCFVRLRPDLRTLEWRFERASPVAHCVRLDCVRSISPLAAAAPRQTATTLPRARSAAAVAPSGASATLDASVTLSDTLSDTTAGTTADILSASENGAKLSFSLVLDSNEKHSAEDDMEESAEDAVAAGDAARTAAAAVEEEEDGASPPTDATDSLRRRARALLRTARADKTHPMLHITCGDAAQARLWHTNLSLLAHTWQATSALLSSLVLSDDATAVNPFEPDAWCTAAQRAAAAAAAVGGNGGSATDWLATPTREERLDYASVPTAHTLATELILGSPFTGSVSSGDGRADGGFAAVDGGRSAEGGRGAHPNPAAASAAADAVRNAFRSLSEAIETRATELSPGADLAISLAEVNAVVTRFEVAAVKTACAAAASSAAAAVAAAAAAPPRAHVRSSISGGKRAWAAKLDTLGTGGAASATGGMRRSLSQTAVADLHRYAGARGAAAAAEADARASGAMSHRSLSLSHLEDTAAAAKRCSSAPPSSKPNTHTFGPAVASSAAASDAASGVASKPDAGQLRPWNGGSQSTSRPIVILSSRSRSSSRAEEHRSRAQTMIVRDGVERDSVRKAGPSIGYSTGVEWKEHSIAAEESRRRSRSHSR